jgi:hypothetical protein
MYPTHVLLHEPSGCFLILPLAEIAIPRSAGDGKTGQVVWQNKTYLTRETPDELRRIVAKFGRLVSVADLDGDQGDNAREHPDAGPITEGMAEANDKLMLAYGPQIVNAVWWKMHREAGQPDPTVAMFYHRETNQPTIRGDLPATDRARITRALSGWGDNAINNAVSGHREELRLLSGGWPVHCGS